MQAVWIVSNLAKMLLIQAACAEYTFGVYSQFHSFFCCCWKFGWWFSYYIALSCMALSMVTLQRSSIRL